MDDKFCIQKNSTNTEDILVTLNISHSQKTIKDGIVSYINIFIIKWYDNTIRYLVYHKPTWTGQYAHFQKALYP